MFEVQTNFIGGWENCWTDIDENGIETKTIFKTREEAQAVIDEFLQDIKDAVAIRDMVEEYNSDDLRIIEI